VSPPTSTPVSPRKHQDPELSQEPAAATVPTLAEDFLDDLANANRSPHTQRGYRSELGRLAAFHPGPAATITVETLRAFLLGRADLAPATRARTEAAISSFLAWAYRHGYINANPMARLDRLHLEPSIPRGRPRSEIDAVLGAIPVANKRDRLLFRLIAETGIRIGEALSLHVEDLDLTADDERLMVRGKGGRQRTVLLDDDRLVAALRAYLRQTGYRHGPLFRAEKNGRGGPLRYQSAYALWATYRDTSGVSCTIHQLRHSHATELVNEGVSLATIRKRLGHRSIQTTLRYAEQSDATADAELRQWRRRRAD